MKFTRGHYFEISFWEFMLFDQQGQRVAHARPRVPVGVAIIGTDICFGDCREEVNLLEVTKVHHGNDRKHGHQFPKWYPRKFRTFKKLKCHYLTAEDWKVCPITRGTGRGHNNYPNILGVAALYHIEPHKRYLAT